VDATPTTEAPRAPLPPDEQIGDPEFVRGRLTKTLYEALELGLEMARSGDSRALSGLVQVARGYRELIGLVPTVAETEGVFRVEVVSPERPVIPGAPDPSSDGPTLN